MSLEPQTHVAELAARHPATIRIFQQHGIDFCCGGKRPLEQAAREQGIDWSALAEELETAVTGSAGDAAESGRCWTEAPLTELIDHIVGHYHGKLRRELPRLLEMAEKALSVHGPKHPELADVVVTLRGLKTELEMHMAKEEQVLFPLVGRLAAPDAGGYPDELCGASLAMPIEVMEEEHEDAAAALRSLRSSTRDFVPPEGACNTFRGLYHGLAELEADTHRHIHLENNVLFPRAAELENRLQR